ncbi:MAG: ATP-binding protein [Deltaproteobacteria bacterium]|nr:ATP-binding protein [Myxococcales bacterium]MDP3217196.1 ATP-binding protein [Deltaproteobacteria bacterium]
MRSEAEIGGPYGGSSPLTRPWLIGFILVGSLSLLAAFSAWRSVGISHPALFVDPYLCFSAVGLPSWRLDETRLRFPDRLISVDGVPIAPGRHPEAYPSRALQRRIASAEAARARTVLLRFDRSGTVIEARRPIFHIGVADVVIFFGLYNGVGLLLLWSAVVIVLMAGRRPAGAAYGVMATALSVFMVSFFDYHSTFMMVPAFSIGSVFYSFGCSAMAYAFPTVPVRFRRPAVIALGVHFALATVAAFALVLGPHLHADTRLLRSFVGMAGPIGSLLLLCVLVVRFRRLDLAGRTEVRTALLGVAISVLVIAVGVAMTMVNGSIVVHLVAPLVVPLIPLSIGFSLIRHNILGADAVLTRRLLVVPVVLLSLGAATIVWLALRSIHLGRMDLLVSTIVSGGVLTGVALGLHRLVGRHLFPAAAEFRPTIQQLAESLTEPQRRDALGESIERTVARWLPSGRIRLLDPVSVDAIDRVPADARGRLDAGQKVWTHDTPWQRHLLVPMRSLGQLRGVLDIAPKHQGALFTEEDLSLLDTIAALGAIALHNAEVMAALDETRRIEVDATRDDKKLTLGLLGAELSHEIAHPLQFFRGLLRRGAKHPLDPDDVEIGGEEIARMERLLGSLRRLEPPPPHRVPVALRQPIARALVLVKETLADKNVRHDVDVPEGLTVIADPDALVQVFANLLRNAAQAAPPRGRVGVVAVPTAHGLTIDVWDDGPGVPEHLVDTLFHRWFTTRGPDGGSGLGLSVAQSLVYGFGWTLEYVRDDARTRFCITVPRSSLAPDRPVDPVVPVASAGE